MTEPFTQGDDDRKELTAGNEASGRLDAWLTGVLDGDLSRVRVKALITGGEVTVNGKIVREAKHRIKPGDRVTLTIPEPEDAVPRPENIPLDILSEDDDLIVLVKPAGLVVHPGAGNPTGTLVNGLLHHCGPSLSGIGGVRRPGIVHRLDKDTSGVMVVAKNDIAHRHLADQFADHGRSGSLRRSYQALVWGEPQPSKGTIDAALGRAGSDRTKRRVKSADASDARHAVTHYEVRQRFGPAGENPPAASLVDCNLETGRTHQIRVHLAHIGHPLIGDRDYGAAFNTKVNTLPPEVAPVVTGFRRQALHAWLLQFEHPRDARVLRFEAPIPTDLENLISAFRNWPPESN